MITAEGGAVVMPDLACALRDLQRVAKGGDRLFLEIDVRIGDAQLDDRGREQGLLG